MMSGLDGTGGAGAGASCSIGKDDSGFCGSGLFSDGKVGKNNNFLLGEAQP
jgi:hypothetical protein